MGPMADDQETPPAPDPDRALIGAQIGDYIVQRRIGHGGMGVVFAGVQPVIKKAVAIKVLQWEIAREPAEVARLLGEAQVVNAIRHRGIVDVIGFGTLPDGRPYLVMELLDGEPLESLIVRSAPLDPVLVVTILCEMLEALGAAHGVGVIHRDLKPSNVFIVRPAHGDPYLKLLDFGLAKRAPEGTRHTPQTRASVVIGTPSYMAPEQACGRPVSPETDMYALGCIAFEMLTHRIPFLATTIYEILAMHINTPAPRVSSLRPEVPPELDEVVDRLLRKEPEQRPSSAQELRQHLLEMRDRWRADTMKPSISSGPAPPDPMSAALLRTLLPSLPPTRVGAEASVPFVSTVVPASFASPPTPSSVEVPASPTRVMHRVPGRPLAAVAVAVVLVLAGVLVWALRGTHASTPGALRATPLGSATEPRLPPLPARSRAPASGSSAVTAPPPIPPTPPPAVTGPGVSASANPSIPPAAVPDAGVGRRRPTKRGGGKRDPFESRQ
jgi:serine/threonine-protein kinase